jgi:hypothetical protein
MAKKAFRQWVRENRERIDAAISAACKTTKEERRGRNNDAERMLWVRNDYGLYQAARAEGCDP